MPCSYSYLQVNFYKRFDGAVSLTVVLKESWEFETKVEGSRPSNIFFAFAKPEILAIYMFAEKSMFWCIVHM